jgi:hypothetical protein
MVCTNTIPVGVESPNATKLQLVSPRSAINVDACFGAIVLSPLEEIREHPETTDPTMNMAFSSVYHLIPARMLPMIKHLFKSRIMKYDPT